MLEALLEAHQLGAVAATDHDAAAVSHEYVPFFLMSLLFWSVKSKVLLRVSLTL
jgi:hypothetical protein